MSDVDERNWMAVSNTLVKQNERFTKLELQIKLIHNKVLMLADELEKLKQERVRELVSHFGPGPTSRE